MIGMASIVQLPSHAANNQSFNKCPLDIRWAKKEDICPYENSFCGQGNTEQIITHISAYSKTVLRILSLNVTRCYTKGSG